MRDFAENTCKRHTHEVTNMVKTLHTGFRTLLLNVYGQDLVEYALLAGFVAVACGAIFPTGLMPSVSSIFSKLGSEFAATSAGS